MLRKVYAISLSVVLLGFLSVFVSSSQVSAINDYVVTVTDSNISNQTVIFEEINIGPGFSGSYNIRINNQSSENIGFNLFSIDEDPVNTLTMNDLGMALSYNGRIVASNQTNSPNLTNHKPVCFGPNTNELLMLHVWLDSGLGNEYQGRSFYADITFNVASSGCDDIISGDNQNPNLPELPNTSESRFILYFLYVLIIIFTILTIWFLILFIMKRKRKDEEKSPHRLK